MADNVASLLLSVVSSWSMRWTSVGRVWFETLLPLTVAIGVALSGEAVLVGTWGAGEVPAPSCGYIPPALLVGTAVENFGSSR